MKKTKLLLSIILCLSLVLVGSTVIFANEYKESPVLTELVEEGELPSIEQRIPEDPFVVGPGVIISEENLDWEVGEHGGTLNTAHHTGEWAPDIFIMSRESLLMAKGYDINNVQGNILKDYEVNEDNTEFTFHMREGLKWSDGVPVTTEDIKFTYEDVLFNEELTATIPSKFKSAGRPDGEPLKLEVIDDYTFKINFEESYGDFINVLINKFWFDYSELLKPKHYLKQFHINYSSLEEMEADLEEEELDDEWWELFEVKDVGGWSLTEERAVDFPVLRPWHRVEGPDGVSVFERNPYYFKVDTEGKQLPYIDEIQSQEVSNLEMVNMKAITGEIDFLVEATALNKMPTYKENEEKGGYETILTKFHFSPTVLFLNYTYDDSTWQEVTKDLRFRKALNKAIDRQEIINSVYLQRASMPKYMPNEYDPERARELLDEMGLDEKNDEGFRIGPDGEVFEIFIELDDRSSDFIPTAELLASHIRDVGIKTEIKQISAELHGQRAAANELQATIGWAHSDTWPDLWNDYIAGSGWWGAAEPWATWYNTNGESGEEPPEWVKELYDIHENIVKDIPGSKSRKEAEEKLLEWYRENIPVLITVDRAANPMIASTDLGNIPHSGLSIYANCSGEQFYFQK